MRWLLLFAAGYYFGRRPGAATQVIQGGQQLLTQTTGIQTQPICIDNCWTDPQPPGPVIPGTSIVTPMRAAGCPPGSMCMTAQAPATWLQSSN